jgi:hypothetical protein
MFLAGRADQPTGEPLVLLVKLFCLSTVGLEAISTNSPLPDKKRHVRMEIIVDLMTIPESPSPDIENRPESLSSGHISFTTTGCFPN